MVPHILLVEDDLVLVDGLTNVLENEGFLVKAFTTGEAAFTALHNDLFSLLVLDIGLPDIDGFELLKRIRDNNISIPVLLLTARDGAADRVLGFDLGTDDYVVKPFIVAELLGRIRALLRRSQGQTNVLNFQGLTMDLNAQRAWLAGTPLDLSTREWVVLEQLLKNVDKVVSKQNIVGAIQGAGNEVSQNAVEVYISRLRHKLDQAIQIRTIHGFGYMIESQADGEK